MYKVIKMFTDLQDDNFKYEVGDEYPRLGLNPSLARIEELKGSNNKQGRPLIEEVEDLPFSDNAVTDEDVKTDEVKAETKKSTKGRKKR